MTRDEAIAIVRAVHPLSCAVQNPETGMMEIWLDVTLPEGMRYGTSLGVAETWIRLAGYIQQGGFR